MKKLTIKIHPQLFLLFFLFTGIVGYAQEPGQKEPITIEAEKEPHEKSGDSVKTIKAEELKAQAPEEKEKDSVKSPLESMVIDNAKGYRRYNRAENKIYLYDNAYVKYGDMELTAGQIIIDLNTNTAQAFGILDSLGNYEQLPVFKQQGSEDIEPDSLAFNFDTKKGLVHGSRTKEGEMSVRSQTVRKENDSTYYIYRTKLTTSSHPDDDPEYYIKIMKGVFVPGVKVIAGFSQMFFYDVPTPVAVPFAYFPMTHETKSGLIFPTFGENGSRGYFVQNGGYYFALNDYVDLAVMGDYYTNGSYGVRIESNYAWRYHFKGNFSFRYENLINGQKGFSDYSRNTIYNIRWSHSQDAKASPNSRFSASVNLGSSKYYRESINQITTPNFLNNTLSSSISYNKTFPAYPSVNLSLTATHSQNTNTESINMTLPTFQGSMERIYPFAPRDGTKKGIFQNINFQYSIRGENRIQTADSLFFKQQMWNDAKLGFQHTIPVATNFKVFKYFSASLTANYNEVWQFKTVKYNDYNSIIGDVVKDTIAGFDRFGTYNMGASLGTTVYGTFNFGDDKKIQAIRHVMRPSVSYGYTPSFDNYYDTYVADESGREVDYTRFEGGLYGSPGKSYSNTLGFSLNNTLEAKVRAKDTTATEPEKIKLLNNLNFSSGYNIAADSLAWSPLRITGSTQFFKNKMTVNFGATLNPYALDASGRVFDEFNINNGGSLFRLTNANLTANYSFSSDSFEGKDNSQTDNTASGGRDDDLFGKAQDFSDSRTTRSDKDEDEEIDNENFSAKLPWDLRLAYSLTYSNNSRQKQISTNSLMISGDIELTPRWKVGASTGYDFKNAGFTYTQLRFERDLESWRLNFNWVPFSTRSSWYFFIGINSSLLSDLKWEKRRPADRSL